jgi:ABC-type transport system substrate-binding protein
MNLYKSNHAYLPQGYLTLIDGDVRLVDETHIQFDTLGPTSLYAGEAPYMYFYILPKHVFEQVEQGNCPDGADPCTPKSYENVPSVGSGPFTIAEYKVGQFVRMERNPFWTGPEPAVDEIIYRFYKNDDALSQALLQGEVDFVYLDTPNIFNSLEGKENIGTVGSYVLRDRPELGLGGPRGRGRVHPARGRAPRPDRRDRPAGDPDGDQQRGPGREGPPRLRIAR